MIWDRGVQPVGPWKTVPMRACPALTLMASASCLAKGVDHLRSSSSSLEAVARKLLKLCESRELHVGGRTLGALLSPWRATHNAIDLILGQ